MDWISSFQRSIDYIEENLTEELSIDRISRVMKISAFYYQNIFTIIRGFSVGEYIRGRRLGNARQRSDKAFRAALRYCFNERRRNYGLQNR